MSRATGSLLASELVLTVTCPDKTALQIMRHAARLDDRAAGIDRLVSGVVIGDERADVVLQHAPRMLAATPAAEVEPDRALRHVVGAAVDPHVGTVRLALARRQQRHRRLVGCLGRRCRGRVMQTIDRIQM